MERKMKLDLDRIEAQSFEIPEKPARSSGAVPGLLQTEPPTCHVDCTFAIDCTGAC